jgi:hypothetical protein
MLKGFTILFRLNATIRPTSAAKDVLFMGFVQTIATKIGVACNFLF